jgi:hypothetical protein
LNPSVYSVGKFVWIKSTSSCRCNFQKKFQAVGDATSIYRRNDSVGIYWRITDGKIPSANADRIGDGIISVGNSVGVIRFSGSVTVVFVLRDRLVISLKLTIVVNYKRSLNCKYYSEHNRVFLFKCY